jgi:hypothetical protein
MGVVGAGLKGEELWEGDEKWKWKWKWKKMVGEGLSLRRL